MEGKTYFTIVAVTQGCASVIGRHINCVFDLATITPTFVDSHDDLVDLVEFVLVETKDSLRK